MEWQYRRQKLHPTDYSSVFLPFMWGRLAGLLSTSTWSESVWAGKNLSWGTSVLERKNLRKALTACKELSPEVWLLLTFPLPHPCIGNVSIVAVLGYFNMSMSWLKTQHCPQDLRNLDPEVFSFSCPVACKGKLCFFGGCWNYHFEFKRFFSNAECCRLTLVRAGPKQATKS